jgi:ribosomal protein S18 acetylase RimI-like enzyme
MDTTTMNDHDYTVLRIPVTSPRITELVSKFRETRLAAIKADPAKSFVQYEVEIQHPLSVWQARLSGSITCLVCVANASADPTLTAEDVLLGGEWVGFAFVRGYISIEEYYAYPEMGQPMPEHPELESRWHIYDLYTLPAHRGHSVGSKLMEASIAVVGSILQADGLVNRRARVRLMANSKVAWLVRWYRDFGFKDSGRATLRQGFVANSMRDSIPKDTTSTEELRAKWETPIGLAMERVIEVA